MARGILDVLSGCYPSFMLGGRVRGILPVFHFHDVTASYLEPYLRYLAEGRYKTVTSDAMERFVVDGVDPGERRVVLCFDDAWKSLGTAVVPLLKKFEFEAITYVIPGRVVEHGESPLSTWQELAAIRDSGVIDIQAHTYSHSMIFCSNKIVGYLTPSAVFSYLGRPMLDFGESPVFLSMEDLGAPIYGMRSRMSDATFYRADDNVREACVGFVREAGGPAFFDRPDWEAELQRISAGAGGTFESIDEKRKAIRRELVMSREQIQSKLGLNNVNQVCFPWAVCGKTAEELARESGFKTAVADALFGKRFMTRKGNPFRIMRLKHQHIYRLPGAARA